MRGIKECVSWLIDNKDKQLARLYDDGTHGNGVVYSERPSAQDANSTKLDIHWYDDDGFGNGDICFTIFETSEWEEVIEPVDFKTAYSDCEENGTSYENYRCGVKLIKNPLGNVVTICNDRVHNTNGDWFKQSDD